MIKALFFDIDGTLVSFRTHRIPQSTIEAIKQAKNNGTKIFISTGRPMSLINNIEEIRHLTDGYITANGAYCLAGGQVIYCNPVPATDVTTVIRYADENNFACMIVGEHDLTMYNTNMKADRIFREMLNVDNLNNDIPIDRLLSQRILQLTPVISEETEQTIMNQLTGSVSCRWCPDFADITARNSDKGSGMKAIIKELGLAEEETMAFGDGGNDVSIVEQAGIGIAMGNANDCLKQVADYTTTSVDEDGVYNALRHFNVI